MPELSSDSRLRLIRLWLFAAAAMIFLTLVVGGATRLTESGLSITEWKPVTGVMPPLSQSEWQAEFQQPRYLKVLMSGAGTAMWNGFRRVNAA